MTARQISTKLEPPSDKYMKIALVMNDNYSTWHFRRGLIETLAKAGHDVTVIFPPGDYTAKFEALGVRCIEVPVSRFINPLADLKLVWRLFKIFRRERFDLIHTLTIKPNIYGTIAARLAGTKRVVALLSGRGFVFVKPASLREWIVSKSALFLYKTALRLCERAWFQNPDDYAFFVEHGLIKREKGIVIVSGGINVDEYTPSAVAPAEINELKRELGIPEDARCVLMVVARQIWSKGIKEYVEAAHALRKFSPDWVFVLLGPREEGCPDEVPVSYLNENRPENLTLVGEFRFDIKRFTAMADIVALPSFYLEGVPRSLLEAAAMAKPIITTDNPGCREVVVDRVNGFIIQPRSTQALTEKLELLMQDEALRIRFGKESRALAERKFSEKIVIGRIISELYRLDAPALSVSSDLRERTPPATPAI